jgi:Domain of unknown function (DUF927)
MPNISPTNPPDQAIAGRIFDERKTTTYTYYEQDGSTFCERIGRNNEKTLFRLANFGARINAVIERHEAGIVSTLYRITGVHEGETREITIRCRDFARMDWVQTLGGGFAIEPGRETRDWLRHGIQWLSGRDGIAGIVEHTSIGWIEHQGKFVYLHANGAIDESGPSKEVCVNIQGVLGKYGLPDPPNDPGEVCAVVRDHLAIWDLAKSDQPGGQAAAAIVATLPFRAVLSAFDSTSHLGGSSGTYKTSVCRLALQHFSQVTGRKEAMPVSWTSTANAIQRFLYDCRDALLPIDDLKHDKSLVHPGRVDLP